MGTAKSISLRDRYSGGLIYLTVRDGVVVGAMGTEPKRYLGMTVGIAKHYARYGGGHDKANQLKQTDPGARVLADLESWGIDREQVNEVRDAFRSGNHRRAMALAKDLGWNRAAKRGRSA